MLKWYKIFQTLYVFLTKVIVKFLYRKKKPVASNNNDSTFLKEELCCFSLIKCLVFTFITLNNKHLTFQNEIFFNVGAENFEVLIQCPSEEML